ncbi:N-acetylneuraminate synthase [Metabacillus halosaccharovorans]|uniref:N-acetylneuraminate synthase n=1 Tax=Metabacillus halosaccharovorans TaxID=930124 RepID=UPI001C1F590E|nr:N-acetylneuraminate synthase [Metabacillus halosaccharovorans]MBU7592277.1 N-acetylneuraminate synthase [Metabacillus halosaccharovorans]
MHFTIGNKTVSPDSEVFIIAEIGVNHNGSLKIAKQLIKHAKDAGADAVKFQTYETDSLVTNSTELADYQRKSQFHNQKEMLEKYQLSKSQFKELKKYCDSLDILFFSTPFDLKSVEILEEIGVDAYKVGSGDLTNFPLIEKIINFNKPLIISTGMSTFDEVKATVNFIPNHIKLAILHCTSAYPAPFEDLNLRAITSLKHFNKIIGYSDHSMGVEIPFAVTSMGYKILEKHLTLDRSLDGPDHKASLIPNEFKQMVNGIRNIEHAMGNSDKRVTPSEQKTKELVRRSIYAGKDLPRGSIISLDDLVYLRPNKGIEACYYLDVIGQHLINDKKKGELLTWDDFLGVTND